MPSSISNRTVAVIGGGASGALVCAHLLAAAPRSSSSVEPRIEWIGNEAPFGLGLAYSTRELAHLLNVPARGMSAFADQPLHFFQWLQERHPETRPTQESFAARAHYGEYLQSLVPENHPSVHRCVDEVISLTADGSRYRLALKSGGRLIADEVVLAMGNLKAQPMAGAVYPDQLHRLGKNDDVLLIGTGLTMIDTVLSLQALGHRGRIFATSRRGLLPRPHRDYRAHTPSARFAAWLESPALSLADSIGVFRGECRLAAEKGSDWRAVLDLVRPRLGDLWKKLSTRQRASFIRHLRPYWDVHRHRLAPELHERIEALQSQGILKITPGRGVKIQAALRIDCTGLIADIAKVPSSLLRSLLDQKIIELDDPAIGVHTSAAHPHVHVIGPLLRGQLWESIAVPEIRVQAQKLAEKLRFSS